jgi:UDP-N-acetylmuramate--alanine ligase
MLENVRKIHFVGIGGAGMCALAEIFYHNGYVISGSDNNETDTLERLRNLGIPVILGHFADNVKGVDLVIHTAAVHSENPELIEAKRQGIPVIERGEMLGILSEKFSKCIGVSGTHGKTTTSSMITQILICAGLDPTAVIGGKLPLIGGNSIAGRSDIIVCEACEFVNSYHHIKPYIAIILNIDDDHLDFFGSIENIIASFRVFANKASDIIVYNRDDQNTKKAVEGLNKKMISFGFNDSNDYYASNIKKQSDYFVFDVMKKNEKIITLTLKVPGKHNILNALAAFVAASLVGATPSDIAGGLNDFYGAGRRFEILGKVKGFTVADDYAHHPAEIAVTLEAAKGMEYNKIWAVFQPFTFSRTATHLDEFARVLSTADRVVLSEIMGSREINTYNIYSKDLAQKIEGCKVFATFEEIADYILENAKEGDLVLTMGCGDIYKAAKLILKG